MSEAKETLGGSPSPMRCSAADGPQLPVNADRSADALASAIDGLIDARIDVCKALHQIDDQIVLLRRLRSNLRHRKDR